VLVEVKGELFLILESHQIHQVIKRSVEPLFMHPPLGVSKHPYGVLKVERARTHVKGLSVRSSLQRWIVVPLNQRLRQLPRRNFLKY
jgi:hypothetical protein